MTPISIVNGSECYVQFSIFDLDGEPMTPSALSYQVWDTTNNIEVVPPTAVTPEQSGSITLSATANTMNAASTSAEQRQVTLKVGIPGGSYENGIAVYTILRKAGTP